MASGGAPRSLPDEVLASLLGASTTSSSLGSGGPSARGRASVRSSGAEPSRGSALDPDPDPDPSRPPDSGCARVSVGSSRAPSQDYLVLLARSQASNCSSSISSDFGGMLLGGHGNGGSRDAPSTTDSFLDSYLRGRARAGRGGATVPAKKRTEPPPPEGASGEARRRLLLLDPAAAPGRSDGDDGPATSRGAAPTKRTKLRREDTPDFVGTGTGALRASGPVRGARGGSSSSSGGAADRSSAADSFRGSCLPSASAVRRESFRRSLDSRRSSRNAAAREDFGPVGPVASWDGSRSVPSREGGTRSIGGGASGGDLRSGIGPSWGPAAATSAGSRGGDLRGRRRGGPHAPLKKRIRPILREVDFDPPPTERRGAGRRGGPGPGGGDGRDARTAATRGEVDGVDASAAPDADEAARRGRAGRGEDAADAVVRGLTTLGRDGRGDEGRGAADVQRPVDDDEGPAGREVISPAEARQLRRLAASIERTGRSRLMVRRAALGMPPARVTAFLAGARGTLTDGLAESRRQLRRYAGSEEGCATSAS